MRHHGGRYLFMLASCIINIAIVLFVQVACDRRVEGFAIPSTIKYPYWQKKDRSLPNITFGALYSCSENESSSSNVIPSDLYCQIQSVAKFLWKDTKSAWIPSLDNYNESKDDESRPCSRGEARLPGHIPYSERGEFFMNKALHHGCPYAQHSYALLLWNGFGTVEQNAKASAQWHAAAALQHNLDAVSVLGGCLRTGTGIKRNVGLGLSLIEFSASCGNPSGVNKKAALLESNDDEEGAFRLYKNCYDNGAANALLKFNLGWCYVHGSGVKKDTSKGIALWQESAEMAPDEGSEEAAYNLYLEFRRDDPILASKWLNLAADLGLEEAMSE
mmetsp:Transcript_2846/g.3264  ORF Transcript_2846/g.3264 Transcript_2846/m.3264 type:complete len:331 (+) Transcript_2846:84-1076(+)